MSYLRHLSSYLRHHLCSVVALRTSASALARSVSECWTSVPKRNRSSRRLARQPRSKRPHADSLRSSRRHVTWSRVNRCVFLLIHHTLTSKRGKEGRHFLERHKRGYKRPSGDSLRSSRQHVTWSRVNRCVFLSLTNHHLKGVKGGGDAFT